MPSKTLLFCTSYIADQQAWQQRYKRWLEHYRQASPGHYLLCMIDDASPFVPPEKSLSRYMALDEIPLNVARPFMLSFPERLGRQALTVYPGWWRSFFSALRIAQRLSCERIVHLESDFYVLSQKMFRELGKIEQGWWAGWCPRYNCAETALQVICADQFATMKLLSDTDHKRFENQFAEEILPFSGFLRQFDGDRYSEFRRKIPANADYAAQVLPEQAVWLK
jgi:hypothetical protein